MDKFYNFEKDRYFSKFINRPQSKSGCKLARNAMRAYLLFLEGLYGKRYSPSALLKKIEEDRKKPPLESGETEREWVLFVDWLKTEYQKIGNGSKTIGASSSTVKLYSGSIKSFYSYFSYPLGKQAKLPPTLKGIHTKMENEKFPYRADSVLRLLSVMNSNRDRALTLTMYQSGMDLSTATSIKYGQIKKGLENENSPLMLKVIRRKTAKAYRTFIGKEALDAIKIHIEERMNERYRCATCGRSWETKRNKCPPPCNSVKVEEFQLSISDGDLIFIPNGISPNTVHRQFRYSLRKYALLAGLISKDEIISSDMNPARPHALRAAFSSILSLNGANEPIINYFLGHEDKYGGAYNQISDEELLAKYKEYERYLSTTQNDVVKEIECKMDEKIKLQETIIKGLQAQMKEMEEREQNRAMNMAGAPSDPLKVALYRRLLELVESDKELLRDYER